MLVELVVNGQDTQSSSLEFKRIATMSGAQFSCKARLRYCTMQRRGLIASSNSRTFLAIDIHVGVLCLRRPSLVARLRVSLKASWLHAHVPALAALLTISSLGATAKVIAKADGLTTGILG